MNIKFAAFFVLALAGASCPVLSDPVTDAFRENLVKESRIRAMKEKEQAFKDEAKFQELLAQNEARLKPCPDIAGQAENLLVSGDISDMQVRQIFSDLPEKCLARPTKTWTLAHTSAKFLYQAGGRMFANAFTFGAVEFKSLLACVRGSKGMEEIHIRNVEYKEVCVDTESGVSLSLN